MVAKIGLLAFIASAFVLLATNALHAQGPFDPHRNAELDFKIAKTRAEAEHKRILLDFGANWCAPCVTLDHLFDTDPEIRRSLDAGFVLVKVPVEIQKDSPGTRALRRQYPKFNLVPHLLVVDPKGKKLWDQPNGPLMSDLRKGIWNSRAVLAFLDKWGSQE